MELEAANNTISELRKEMENYADIEEKSRKTRCF